MQKILSKYIKCYKGRDDRGLSIYYLALIFKFIILNLL